MERTTLGEALEREHREIDGGIETYTTQLTAGDNNTDPLVSAMEGLRRHIYLEEEFLFPPLREGGMTMPIFVMLREHGELWNSMDGVQTMLDGAADTDTVLDACRELLSQLDKHNAKEEPIIYTKADSILTGTANAQLLAFLDAGRMPEGWVCSAAAR